MVRNVTLSGALLLCLSTWAGQALACEGHEVIFEDNFADDSGGWAMHQAVEVKDGTFVFKLAPDDMQTDLNVTFTVQDADICSDVVWPEGGPQTLGAGLLFWGEDNKDYFQFGILNNGKFWIARKQDGKWHTVVENVESSVINNGSGAANTLRVKVTGNTASFFINGTKVRDLRGQPPKGGWRFGLSGDNFDKDKEARILFRKVKVTD
jgi:3-keto-disaccharide hydrolase